MLTISHSVGNSISQMEPAAQSSGKLNVSLGELESWKRRRAIKTAAFEKKRPISKLCQHNQCFSWCTPMGKLHLSCWTHTDCKHSLNSVYFVCFCFACSQSPLGSCCYSVTSPHSTSKGIHEVQVLSLRAVRVCRSSRLASGLQTCSKLKSMNSVVQVGGMRTDDPVLLAGIISFSVVIIPDYPLLPFYLIWRTHWHKVHRWKKSLGKGTQ